MDNYSLRFDYAKQGRPYELGRGRLRFCLEETILFDTHARTGSVDGSLQLVNAIHRDDWWIRERSQDTKENAMVLGNIGWKIRLWQKEGPRYRYTRYLIHPDGGVPGSQGCIVTPTLCLELRDMIDDIIAHKQPFIPLYVNKEAV